jgi:hypothetical protein
MRFEIFDCWFSIEEEVHAENVVESIFESSVRTELINTTESKK